MSDACAQPALTSHPAQVLLRLPQLLGLKPGWESVPENACKEKCQAVEQADVKALMQEDHVPGFLLHCRITPRPEVGIADMELS